MYKQIEELESIFTSRLTETIDLQNIIARKELEKVDMLNEVALGIIDVIDSFERIEENIAERNAANNEAISKTMVRYKSILKKLLNLLQKHGISKIDFPENRLIVGLCEVVDTVPDPSKKNDEIYSIVRSGYIRGKELIRAAQLIVIKN